ncbi:hypothetical protein BOTBODRAFT_571605 [Botryobasidium botryosum FD-172 SS1]|uniref:Uncharacterized protein n=1 Tax=Botryobasidium botryosum (strain FD-172 SS1) TaxID=930990 RepID=A0A067M9N3_BOTB1|nr:hypothetical protein BOTBODRAFT_571605 [Botryobasidium botryosum FD-172 SS1]
MRVLTCANAGTRGVAWCLVRADRANAHHKARTVYPREEFLPDRSNIRAQGAAPPGLAVRLACSGRLGTPRLCSAGCDCTTGSGRREAPGSIEHMQIDPRAKRVPCLVATLSQCKQAQLGLVRSPARVAKSSSATWLCADLRGCKLEKDEMHMIALSIRRRLTLTG